MRGYVTLLPEELDALIGLSHEAFRLYVYLRQFMLRSNGEAFGHGVSWPEIASQGLYLAPRSGVQGTGRPDDRKMHRVRDELIRAGALENVGDHKTHLRFRFPIFIQNCEAYFSAQKQAAPKPQVDQAPKPQAEKPMNTNTYSGIDAQAAGRQNAQAAPYTDSINQSINQATDRFSMFPNWKPSEFFEAMAKRSMLDIAGEHQRLYAVTFAEFVMFWSTSEAQQRYPAKWLRSQGEWERALLQALLRAKAMPVDKPVQPTHKPLPVRQPDGVASHPSYKSVEEVRRESANTSAVDKARDQEALRRLAALGGVDPASLGVKA